MPPDVSAAEYRALAEFRYRLRRFVHFSEQAALDVGVEPRQHQLLLAVRGLPVGISPTIGVLAERLQLKHHSTVELIDRCEARGLVRRTPHGLDRRQVVIALTAAGERLLRRLSVVHRAELRSVGSELLDALTTLVGARAARGGLRGSAA
jgi:DNA-binding MarR family transcriptional regulator